MIVGDGPEREPLAALAASLGVFDGWSSAALWRPEAAAAAARAASVFVLPSVDEAFGVAYIEAMAGGVPAIGCAGEDGPEEIAAAGDGHGARAAARPGRAGRHPGRPLSDPPVEPPWAPRRG